MDPFVHETLSAKVDASLKGSVDACIEVFSKECCDEEIERLKKHNDVDLVAGIGGGKTMDTSKAVAHALKCPVAIIPTLASTDAPCTALSVIYTKTGEFSRYLELPQNPNLVLVDSEIIAHAPVRFLVSGMGDALATWFEGHSCFSTQSVNLNGQYMGNYTAYGVARLCYETIMTYGEVAKKACETQTTCPALERVIEANTLMSGLGAESCGLGAAHAIHNGLTALEETHSFTHGEKVAFGTQVGLFLTDGNPADIEKVYAFCENVGLPTTLADIGVTRATDDMLMKVALASTAEGETIHHESGVVLPKDVVSAIKAADAYGRSRKVK
ncbi:glycerol dehydrogenase [Angomonas deanei]|uniref:Iron-containing alcohol dehydrogenase, putative n=1 Tax=Angomonas deanei TaxID=59799 RepID=A0A7G2CTD7_9TRYP|nr:glycerol dehydrogenase [Angomonas deanei]CAD2222517.1 Iron-containing alcohol dehydrogenase, putative [Angomonas deanei]|eukprot:EPY18888.1 glycerol dehydrogenase [Angomonas deanei]